VVLLALVVLQNCHTSGVAGSGGVTKVSRKGCCWLCQHYRSVTQVVLLALMVYQVCHAMVLLALVVYQVCHASGFAGSGGVTKGITQVVSLALVCYKCVTQVVLLALVVLQMFYTRPKGCGQTTQMCGELEPHQFFCVTLLRRYSKSRAH
jgi:hypothetical protein